MSLWRPALPAPRRHSALQHIHQPTSPHVQRVNKWWCIFTLKQVSAPSTRPPRTCPIHQRFFIHVHALVSLFLVDYPRYFLHHF
ncbi:uncharacterized protein BKA78DRAFT_153539 [Phyllosticta capitalensis]|uniref:uncharacterized protein n=1 Tax=Phyllosticta capitalensis TaxID=121624 RepID=UPI00313233CE